MGGRVNFIRELYENQQTIFKKRKKADKNNHGESFAYLLRDHHCRCHLGKGVVLLVGENREAVG